jgi:glycosyltransferase involved in cell wall biosynthesis
MKPIKVLHIAQVETDNYYLNNLCDYTNKSDVEFSAITFAPHGGFIEGMEKRGVRAYALDSLSRKRYPHAFSEIWKICQKENPDIVHTHVFDPTVIGLAIGKLQRRKVIVTRHYSDALYQLQGFARRKFYFGLEKFISSQADLLIAPSKMVRDILVEREQVSAKKVTLIPYGQTWERFSKITPELIAEKRAELGINDFISLVCVSRLFHRKGHIYLFEALAPILRKGFKLKLYLVGTGDYQSILEDLAAKLGISESVQFLGWRNDALEIMASADIIVHPSLEDALSSALIEGLMLGKPIIASDISGARDTLADGEFGKIVPPENSEAFRFALEEILLNIDSAKKRAAGGRQHLLKYMDAKRVANEYLECYQKVLNLK